MKGGAILHSRWGTELLSAQPGPSELIIGSQWPENLGWYHCRWDIWNVGTQWPAFSECIPLPFSSENRKLRQRRLPQLENSQGIISRKAPLFPFTLIHLINSFLKGGGGVAGIKEITFYDTLIEQLFSRA